jgi:ABC-2 type transport system permease protein
MSAVDATTTSATTADAVPAGGLAETLRVGAGRTRIELLSFSRQRQSVVFTMLFPVVLLVIFGAVFNRDIAPGVTFTQYFVSGMIAAGLLGASFQNLAITIAFERERGLLKRLSGTPMPRAAYFVGKVAMVWVIAVVETAILLAIGAVLYGVDLPTDASRWWTFTWVTLLGVSACTLCGIAFSSVPRNADSAPAVVSPIAIVLQFISGVFFIVTELPQWMQILGAVFPLRWMAQGMRAVFLPDDFAYAEIAGSYELGKVALVLGAWTIGGLILCVLTFRWRSSKDG